MPWWKYPLGIALAGLMGGCGATAATASHPSQAPTSAHAAPLTSVTFLSSVNEIGYTPIFLGIQQGIFRKYGLQAKVVQVSGSITAQDAVVGGSAPFALTTAAGLLLAKAKQVPLEAVVGMDVGIPFQLVVSNAVMATHHLTTHSPLSTVMQALAGQKFGVLGPTDNAYITLLFKHFHITTPPAFISLSSNGSLIPSLQQGLIAGFVTAPPIPEITAAKKVGTVVVSLRTVGHWGSALEDVVATSQAEVKKDPGLVRRTAEAVAASVRYAVAHPKQLIALDSQRYHVSPQLLKTGLPAFQWISSGKMTAAMWAEATRENVKAGQIAATVHMQPNVDWTNAFVTGSP